MAGDERETVGYFLGQDSMSFEPAIKLTAICGSCFSSRGRFCSRDFGNLVC
jgi:hypothetical protein